MGIEAGPSPTGSPTPSRTTATGTGSTGTGAPLEIKANFQHNDTHRITPESYAYVAEYKRQLVEQVTRMMVDLDVHFVLSHGTLIESERGKPIYHDDDVDIRFDHTDSDKWHTFCQQQFSNTLKKYNLRFDDRLKQRSKQEFNGIQCWLLNFDNPTAMKTFPEMDIHCDLVANVVLEKFWWVDYDIDYSRMRQVRFLGVLTYVPSKPDTARVLTKEYGASYIEPIYALPI